MQYKQTLYLTKRLECPNHDACRRRNFIRAMFSLNSIMQIKSNFAGSATYGVPIEVPPGRGVSHPILRLYTTVKREMDGSGVGWNLDMGAIQRSTKFGVNYNNKAILLQ